MDTGTFFIIIAIMFELLLVAAVVWGICNEKQLLAWEAAIAARIRKQLRHIKRELLARWLAKDGLTVRPMSETETALRALPPVKASADELLEIIGRWSE